MKWQVFISYYHDDENAVNYFLKELGDLFIAKAVGVEEGDFEFDGNNSEYIMEKKPKGEVARFYGNKCSNW